MVNGYSSPPTHRGSVGGNATTRGAESRHVGSPRHVVTGAEPQRETYAREVGKLADWAEATATLILGVIGLRVANNFRRQARTALTVRTAEAHAQLWAITAHCPPTLGKPPSSDVRTLMAKEMSDWYFASGNGMYLSTKSRKLFFAILGTLGAEGIGIQPECARVRLDTLPAAEREGAVACLARREISLLRTQLKTDLAVYHERSTFGHLRSEELALLKECGISRPLTARTAMRFLTAIRSTPNACSCGTCD